MQLDPLLRGVWSADHSSLLLQGLSQLHSSGTGHALPGRPYMVISEVGSKGWSFWPEGR